MLTTVASKAVNSSSDIYYASRSTGTATGDMIAYYDKDKDQLGALIYISVVLGVFAMSVFVLVCQYARSVSSDEDNSKYLLELMQRLEDGFDPRRKMTGKLALSALNIANKCVIEEPSLQRLTFV